MTRQKALPRGVRARGLNQQVGENASGGGSDGNFAAPSARPVLDSLGPLGAGAHADDERVSLSSIDERADLVAALLRQLTDSGSPQRQCVTDPSRRGGCSAMSESGGGREPCCLPPLRSPSS
jgi:hypothetical protein